MLVGRVESPLVPPKSQSGKSGNLGCVGPKVVDYRAGVLLIKKRYRMWSAMAFIREGEHYFLSEPTWRGSFPRAGTPRGRRRAP